MRVDGGGGGWVGKGLAGWEGRGETQGSIPAFPDQVLLLGVHRLYDQGHSGDEWCRLLQLLLAAVVWSSRLMVQPIK